MKPHSTIEAHGDGSGTGKSTPEIAHLEIVVRVTMYQLQHGSMLSRGFGAIGYFPSSAGPDVAVTNLLALS